MLPLYLAQKLTSLHHTHMVDENEVAVYSFMYMKINILLSIISIIIVYNIWYALTMYILEVNTIRCV